MNVHVGDGFLECRIISSDSIGKLILEEIKSLRKEVEKLGEKLTNHTLSKRTELQSHIRNDLSESTDPTKLNVIVSGNNHSIESANTEGYLDDFVSSCEEVSIKSEVLLENVVGMAQSTHTDVKIISSLPEAATIEEKATHETSVKQLAPSTEESIKDLQVSAALKVYECLLCDKTFTDHGSYYLHRRSHKDQTTYKCRHCNKLYRLKKSLRKHIMDCHRGIVYECNVCKKQLKNKCSLKTHMLTHSSDKQFQCDECGLSFKLKNTLRMHQRLHTGERPFVCDICGESYIQKKGLDYHHTRQHAKKRPFPCEYCEKRFYSKWALTEHTRIHTGIKPYPCNVCCQSFPRKNYLTYHINKSHK